MISRPTVGALSGTHSQQEQADAEDGKGQRHKRNEQPSNSQHTTTEAGTAGTSRQMNLRMNARLGTQQDWISLATHDRYLRQASYRRRYDYRSI